MNLELQISVHNQAEVLLKNIKHFSVLKERAQSTMDNLPGVLRISINSQRNKIFFYKETINRLNTSYNTLIKNLHNG